MTYYAESSSTNIYPIVAISRLDSDRICDYNRMDGIVPKNIGFEELFPVNIFKELMHVQALKGDFHIMLLTFPMRAL
jgi:hypothetical protein